MVDWSQFERNNYEKESTAFEQMIYLLFCSKYNCKEGILLMLINQALKQILLKLMGSVLVFKQNIMGINYLTIQRN